MQLLQANRYAENGLYGNELIKAMKSSMPARRHSFDFSETLDGHYLHITLLSAFAAAASKLIRGSPR